MAGLIAYLFGPGKANEHELPHVIASNNPMVLRAGRSGAVLEPHEAFDIADELDTARIVFGTRITRTDKAKLKSAQERGFIGSAAIAEATCDENVFHVSLSLSPEETAELGGALAEDRWATIAAEFMAGMGFDSPDDAPARWVAVHHGPSKREGDHIHIVASRVRDDGSIVKMWFPEPGDKHPTGDYARSQRVVRDIERRHGLRITNGAAQRYVTKGTAPAQDNIAARRGRTEPAKDSLARRVRAVAYAAESETEFVRMARASGLLVRPRYAAQSRTEVVGYSVALPTSEYATKDDAPVWHGGGKLGKDLTLPRLREHWPAPDDAHRADALAAWAHNQREAIDPNHFPAPTPPKRGPTKAGRAQSPKAGRAPRGMSHAQAKARLADTLREIAAGARSETAFVAGLSAHPDVIVRPRFAKGEDRVTGYSAALHPRLYADAEGRPIWHGAGKLGADLSLPTLRSAHSWADSVIRFNSPASAAWARVSAGGRAAESDVDATAAAARWRATTDRLAGRPDAYDSDGRWARAARETAGFTAAWSAQTEGDRPGEMAELSDALASAAGRDRSPHEPGRASAPGASLGGLKRAAALMLAASHDDPRYAWAAMYAQLSATTRTISAGLRERGYDTRADRIDAATVAAGARYGVDTATAPAPTMSPEAARAAAIAAVSHPTDPRTATRRSDPGRVHRPRPGPDRSTGRDDYGR